MTAHRTPSKSRTITITMTVTSGGLYLFDIAAPGPVSVAGLIVHLARPECEASHMADNATPLGRRMLVPSGGSIDTHEEVSFVPAR